MSVRARAILIMAVIIIAAMIIGGFAVHRWWPEPAPIVTPGPVGNTQIVTVEKPVLDAGVASRYLQDRAEAARLVRDLEAARAQVTVLTETVARLSVNGGGPVTPKPGQGAVAIPDFAFGDSRLDFAVAGGQATYTIHPTIEALAAVGKNGDGKLTAAVRLFDVGPDGTRTELTDAKTTVVAATPSAHRWRLGLAVQAGVGLTGNLMGADRPGLVAGVQWLRRGSSPAAEDSTLSIGTLGVYAGDGVLEPALLPVSINLGQIPRQPFRDLWLSPILTPHRLGVALTATF